MHKGKNETAYALGFLLCSLACHESAAERLQGRWIGKEVELLGGEVSAVAEGWVRGTTLSFSDTELTVSVPGQPSRTGSYAILEEKNDQVVVQVRGHHGHLQETHLTLETKRLMRWRLSERQTVLMERM